MTVTRRRAATVGGGVAGGAGVVGGLAAAGSAAYFARKVLTPDRRKPDDTPVLEVGEDYVVLGATPESVVPGRYGLWLDAGAGHARVGDLRPGESPAGTVCRDLLGVDRGRLREGTARWNGYYFGGPPTQSLGVETEHVMVPTDVGELPAWQLLPESGPSDAWAVLVHGRGARREECLRAVKPLRDKGFTVLIPHYRNDEGAPSGPDGRYNLGLSEWRDVEAAVTYAVAHGARRVVLGGWSMGGAIVLQFFARSAMADSVERAFLDAPVVDWTDVLIHHARLHRVPDAVSGLSRLMMGRSWGRRLVGVHDVLDLAQTDWVARADELRHPLLIVHSVDDEFVPVGPSQRLEEARPDLVRLEPWAVARHTKEWNTDPQRWERVIADFVGEGQ